MAPGGGEPPAQTPLQLRRCEGRVKFISFIESRQREMIEKTLRDCGLWQGPLRTSPIARDPPGKSVEEQTDATGATRELQLILDPEFL